MKHDVKVNDGVLDSWEYVELLGKLNSGDINDQLSIFPLFLDLLFDEENKKKFLFEIKGDRNFTPAKEVIKELGVFLGEINSKN